LEQGKDSLVFSFQEHTQVEPRKILKFMEEAEGKVRFTPDSRLIVQTSLTSAESIFHAARDILTRLQD
jgi:transcription-repair coupling factor (superfamily II helicase)